MLRTARRRRRSALLGLCAAWGALLAPSFVLADGWGDVAGQIVLRGEIPATKELLKKGDPTAKDCEVCAKDGVASEELVVDPQTKGIAHVFVYPVAWRGAVHPDLAKSAVPEVVCAVRSCRFVPHALVVRTDQKVRIRSEDPIAHNAHGFPVRNFQAGMLLRPGDQVLAFPLPEPIPIQAKCDIHPWMLAHWLVVDHPYAAATNAKGEFRIEKLPVGEHEFRVWHERVGYLERAYKVTVKTGETTRLAPLVVPAEKFQD